MSVNEPSAGDRIGRYELVGPLGRGGMGQVWEAVLHGPRGFRKTVALKLARTAVADPTRREALIVEARLGARLHHPNLVGTLELGQHEGRWFVAMELVNGVATSALVARGPLVPEAVVEIGIQACAGLAELHALDPSDTSPPPPPPREPPRRPPPPDETASGSIAATWWPDVPASDESGSRIGWVHRDIKPSNLLVDRTGVVKVADLGVARLAGEVGRAAGTAGYMPPEQRAGQEDARADLFALGVTLLELATGTHPFGLGSAGMQAVHELDVRVPELVDQAESLLPGLGRVVGRCLQADPEHRPPSAAALAEMLSMLVSPRARTASLLRAVGANPEAAGTPIGSSPHASAGRVPFARDRFFGRTGDRQRIEAALGAGERLVTLVGLGGSGKTRLAREIAESLRGAWPGGVWWLDLVDASSPTDLAAIMVRALGVQLADGDADEQLVHCLAEQGRALVVLDNVEQIRDAVVERLGAWLDQSAVSILATSRTALRARGERIVRVGPLERDAAMALFVERAPGQIESTDGLAALVETLDGLPLAIELAAARTRVLGIAQLREKLDHGLRLLSGGPDDVPERHRSLAACLGSSFDALSATARQALGQLTVFVGGITLEAAEFVLDLEIGSPWPVDVVQELVDAQLIEFEAPTRFRMLGLVKHFARRRADPTVLATAKQRHGAWFATFGTPAAIESLRGVNGEGLTARLVAEIGNLTAARDRALAEGDASTAAACAIAAWEVQRLRGPFLTAAHRLEAVLEQSGEADRVRLMVAAGAARHTAGDVALARRLWEGALVEARARGERLAEGDVLLNLSSTLRTEGRVTEARDRAESALAIFRDLGQPAREALTFVELGLQQLLQDRDAGATALLTDAIALFRSRGLPHRATRATSFLAGTLIRAGRTTEARALLRATIESARRVGDVRTEGLALAQLSQVSVIDGQLDEARQHIDASLGLNRRIGARRMEGMLLGNLATLDKTQGRYAEALVNHQAALVVHREVGNLKSEAIVLCNRGSLLMTLDRLDEAEESLNRAMALHEAVGSRRYLGNVIGNLACLRLAQGRLDEAEPSLDEALTIAREVGDRRHEGLLLDRFAELHRRRGDVLLAEEALGRAAEALADASPLERAATLASRVELELDRGRVAEARVALGEATALAEQHDAPKGSELGLRLTKLRRRLPPRA